jgi:hypothetical protein
MHCSARSSGRSVAHSGGHHGSGKETLGKEQSLQEKPAQQEDAIFCESFGCCPLVALAAWSMLEKQGHMPPGGTIEHLLWTLQFIKVCGETHTICRLCGVNSASPCHYHDVRHCGQHFCRLILRYHGTSFFSDLASTEKQAWKHIPFETKYIKFCKSRVFGHMAQTQFAAVVSNLYDRLDLLKRLLVIHTLTTLASTLFSMLTGQPNVTS